MKIYVKFLSSSEMMITLPDDSTVKDLKTEVSQKFDISYAKQIFYFKGKKLQDDQTLESYGIVSESSLKLVIKSDTCTDAQKLNETSLQNTTNTNKKDNFVNSENNINDILVSSDFDILLKKLLLKHFTHEDSDKILQKHNKNFELFIKELTLPEIERVAKANILQK